MLSHGIPANPLSFKHDRSQKKQNNEFVSVKWNIPLHKRLSLQMIKIEWQHWDAQVEKCSPNTSTQQLLGKNEFQVFGSVGKKTSTVI